jgi:hypothetical protein
MNLEIELLVNKFGQELIDEVELGKVFSEYDMPTKKAFLLDMINLILQSKVTNEDIDLAIINSKLKPTFTPCVMLKKGLKGNNLYKIQQLPESEFAKIFSLFINLFKVGYQRRFTYEKNDPNKWWYWDFSDKKNLDAIELKIRKSR